MTTRKCAATSLAAAGLAVAVCAAVLGPSSALAASATDPPRLTLPAGVTCPNVMVYASRGSGESFDDGTLGAGAQLRPLFEQLQLKYGAGNVGLMANGYPAVPVTNPWTHGPGFKRLILDYKPSVLRGVADAVADITGYFNQCGGSGYLTLVVAGYSQGADVVRRALAQIPPSSVPYGFSVQTILLGDPNFDPQEDFTFGSLQLMSEHGAYAPDKIGRGRQFYHASRLPAPPSIDMAYLVSSWCHNDDPICQGGDLVSQHTNYASLDVFTMASLISASVPWLTPVAFPYFYPAHGAISVSPAFFPPIAGPSVGQPSSAFYITTVDGRRVDERTVYAGMIGSNGSYSIPMPDTNWHDVAVYGLGHLLEEKMVRAS